MAEVSIPYRVPVQVIVDTDTREVTRVVVVDEEVTHHPDGYWELEDEVDRADALEIAGEADWPGWDFGF